MKSPWAFSLSGIVPQIHRNIKEFWLYIQNTYPDDIMSKLLVEIDTGLRLTHWGRVTHICISKVPAIGSDNGLSPGRRQAIIWTNAGILLIGSLWTNFSEILIKIRTFSFKKMCFKVSCAKWRPCCLGLNVFKCSYFSLILHSSLLDTVNSVQFIIRSDKPLLNPNHKGPDEKRDSSHRIKPLKGLLRKHCTAILAIMTKVLKSVSDKIFRK